MVRPSPNPPPPQPHHHRLLNDNEDVCDDDLPDEHKGKCGGHDYGRKGTSLRSKHSETEQHRRSKINERFQTLRDLIPQNDQKRDKASLLLEVIGYIQYLQAKLQMYEGSCHGYNHDQDKLTPWGGRSASPESHADPSLISKGEANQDDNDSTTPALKVFSELRDPIGTSDSQMQTGMFPYNQRGVLAGDPATEYVVANVVSDPQIQVWPVPVNGYCLSPNNAENDPEQLTSESYYSGFSSDLSQGILNNLTLALQSSGVDISQVSISVQMDVRKQGGERKGRLTSYN